MTMDNLIKRLEDVWGKFERDQSFFKQCDVSNGKGETYLNILFEPIPIKEYSYIEQQLNCHIIPELLEIYKKFNGFMLFDESLRVYGLSNSKKALYFPSDLVQRNVRLSYRQSFSTLSNYLVFGNYSNHLFCYEKTKTDSIYSIDQNTGKILHTFNSISEQLTHYINYLINEYDSFGIKKHQDPALAGLPMANTSVEYI